MKPVAIFGAGGFAREVLALLYDMNDDRPRWEVVGLLTDDETLWGTELNGVPVVGSDAWVRAQTSDLGVILGVGSPATKARVVERLRDTVRAWPTVVHPNVVCSRRVSFAQGVVVTAGNILTTEIALEDFCMVNLACTVGHDCRLGHYSTVSPGVNISGYVDIGAGCDLGTGASIIQGVKVGEWSIVGAGSVVNKDIPSNCTAIGVPARVIKERPPGWQRAGDT